MVFVLILVYECSNKIHTHTMVMWDKMIIFYLTVKDFNKQSYKNLYDCIFHELSQFSVHSDDWLIPCHTCYNPSLLITPHLFQGGYCHHFNNNDIAEWSLGVWEVQGLLVEAGKPAPRPSTTLCMWTLIF